MSADTPWLKDLFLASKGKPVYVDGTKFILLDRIEIPASVLVHVEFVGEKYFLNSAAVIAVRKPDKIYLSDGSTAIAVAIWDELDLPRQVVHRVVSERHCLEVYHKYRIFHSSDFVTEDSFTGNAGMHVVEMSENRRRYECSNGVGPISLDDLVFEVWWEPLPA